MSKYTIKNTFKTDNPDICCMLTDWIPVLRREIEDTLRMIDLIEQYAGDVKLPASILVSELNDIHAKRIRSPEQRVISMIEHADECLRHTNNADFTVVPVPSEIKAKLGTFRQTKRELDDRIATIQKLNEQYRR